MRYMCLPNELTKCSNSDYNSATITSELCWHFCIAAKAKRYTGSQANTLATSLAPCYHTLETEQAVELMGSVEINISFSYCCCIFELQNSSCERHIHPWRNNWRGWCCQSFPTCFPQGTFTENTFMRILQFWTCFEQTGILAGMGTTWVLLNSWQNSSVTSCCWEKRVS